MRPGHQAQFEMVFGRKAYVSIYGNVVTSSDPDPGDDADEQITVYDALPPT
jgi:hypothetical protein